jgi:hypothetical protein
MAAFTGILLPFQVSQLTGVAVHTVVAWTAIARNGARINRGVRIRVWNGTSWITAPPS